MLRQLTMAVVLLLLTLLVTNAYSYPLHGGRVTDEAGILAGPQRDDLTRLLTAQTQATGLEGQILVAPSLETWDLDAYAERLLQEWRAQGVTGEESWLLLILTDQHRTALALTDPLADRLDPWTRKELDATIALHCEEGGYYAAAQAAIQTLGAPPAQASTRPDVFGFLRSNITLIGLAILTLTMVRHARLKQAPKQVRPLA